MKLDQILEVVGEFGPYQKRIFVLLFLSAIVVPMQFLSQVFLAGTTDHWCAVSHWSEASCATYNLSSSECAEVKRDLSTPLNTEASLNHCTKYDLRNVAFDIELDPSNLSVIDCDEGWTYDHSLFKSTIISDFDLVCDKKTFTNLAQSASFAGILIGCLVYGTLCDVIGRYWTLVFAVIPTFISGILVAVSPNFWFYTFFRFLVVFSANGILGKAIIIIAELVGPRHRVFVGIVMQYSFSIGIILLAGVAYFIREWRNLQIAITVPCVLVFLVLPFIPESPRWLISKGRLGKTKALLEDMAKQNKKSLPPNCTDDIGEKLEKGEENTEKRSLSGFSMIFTNPVMRMRTLNLMYQWSVQSLVYYGISLSMNNLGGNIYASFFISGAVEFPSLAMTLFTVQRFGRRFTMLSMLTLGGISCLATTITPLGPWRLAVAMVGKYAITSTFATIVFYTAELFPTNLRGVGVAICAMASRLSGFLCPIILLLDVFWAPLPLVIFGSSCILAAFIVIYLPETKGTSLPETMQEAIDLKWRNGKMPIPTVPETA